MVDTSEPRISYLSKKSNILPGLTLYPALIVTKGFSPSQRFIRKQCICDSFEKKKLSRFSKYNFYCRALFLHDICAKLRLYAI